MNLISKIFWPITAPIRFIQRNFKTVLFLTIIFYVANSTDPKDLQVVNLQTIELSGPIISANEILEKINKAKKDNKIKGVLLSVNSPGGAVAPSVEIAYAIKELNAIKPVVAYASGIMASGSYYSSIWASKIVANPGSMIGSIGVIMQSVDASELLSKIGVKTQTVKIGTYKEAGTPTRKWTKAEKQELENVIGSTYDMFITDVSNARKLKKDEHKKYADAHIFTSIQAKNVGLVDEVATISRAKSLVVELSGVSKPVWSKEDKMEKFMEKIMNGTVSAMVNNMNGLLAY
ncbi:MAG: signal peptide peptidase SppA [Campylobacterota bacterium]|nr:signal peptide peptidase SppA [Campylobacterota bacterium]